MPSFPQLCATDLFSFSFLSLVLSLNTGVQGATLREPSLWENKPHIFRSSLQTPPPPSVAMLQALQYIQSLSQQTSHDPVTSDHKSLVPDEDLNDMEHVRAMLQLATPFRSSGRMQNGRGKEVDRDREDEKEEEKGQEWIQAIFSTLQQTEDQMKTPRRSSHSLIPSSLLFPRSPASEPKLQQERQSVVEDYGRNLQANQGVRRRHRKIPQMTEHDTGEDQLLKRTSENAEDTYMPQKLATLQSVFEELGRITNSKVGESNNNNEDNDGYRQKKKVFKDVSREEEELIPLVETIEQEGEETERHKFNSGFGNKEEERQVEEDSDTDGYIKDKRFNQLDSLEIEKVKHPDDISQLVDYYLMKVMEEREEQKRDQRQEEEEDEEEEESDEKENRGEEEEEGEEEMKRRTVQLQYTVDPQSLRQLLQISRKLQIPPDDILDLLESDNDKAWQHMPAQTQTHSTSYTGSYDTNKNPGTAPYLRPVQVPETSSVTQDILRLLGLTNAEEPKNKSFLNQYKSALNHEVEERELPDYAFSENSRDQREADYDDTVDQDELASFLAAKMLEQRLKRAPLVLEQAAQDYFDEVVRRGPEKRQDELEDTAGNSDEETLLSILNYLNSDSEDTDELDINGKTAPEM